MSSLLFQWIVLAVSAEAASTNAPQYNSLPMPGRVTFSATGTSVGILGADGMLPIYGNHEGFLFGDLMGDGATDSTFLVSPGAGYRHIIDNQMLGAYFFGDYEKVSLGENFWVVSPGVEWANAHWDAHVNGYFPTSQSEQMGPAVFANTLGDNSQVAFETGTHNQYDELVASYDVIGNGVDAEFGYSFAGENNYRSRVYVGGYYYQPQDVENITGVTAGFEQPLSKNLSVTIMNSYDPVSLYTIGAAVKLTFGGESNTYSNDVHDRLFDTVQRHVGIIGTGAGTYDQENQEDLGMGLEYDNIYFTSPNGTGDGTYGNPAALTQTELNAINAESPNSARIYLQGDSVYTVDSTTAGTPENPDKYNDYGLYVYNGQDLYGRSSDYTAPANSSDQPEIQVDTANGYNGFVTQGGENTFSDLNIIAATGNTHKGIIAFDGTLNVENTTVSGFNNGVYAENTNSGTSTVNIINSTLKGNHNDGLQIYNDENGTLMLNVLGSTVTGNTNNGIGINNTGTGTLGIEIRNSTLNNNYNGLSMSNSSTGTLTVRAENSTFNNNRGDGLFAHNSGNGTTTITAINSQFNHNTLYGIGINNSASGTLDIASLYGSTFDNNGAGGIYGLGTSTATTTINYTGASFSGPPQQDVGSNGYVVFQH